MERETAVAEFIRRTGTVNRGYDAESIRRFRGPKKATNMNITGCCNSDTLPKSRSLSLRTAAIEQLRQLGKIDRHLPRLIRGQKAGVSCCVRVGSTVEHAKLHPRASSTANPLWISTIRHGPGKRSVMFRLGKRRSNRRARAAQRP